MDNFLRSAGAFQYILENFTNAPSMDLSPDTLEMLVHLMCAQARECLFEKAELSATRGDEEESVESSKEDKEGSDGGSRETTPRTGTIEECLLLGQEAAHVSPDLGNTYETFFHLKCVLFRCLRFIARCMASSLSLRFTITCHSRGCHSRKSSGSTTARCRTIS